MIKLNSICKAIDGRRIVENCSFTVAAGEAACICGSSGIGKTTLLEIVAGIVSPDSGAVHLASKNVAYTFQDDILVPWLSALDNLLLIMPDKSLQTKTKAISWLNIFGLKPDVFPPQMSGGMQRRLSLARAFAAEPEILLLDEPFAFLDDAWQQATAQAVKQYISSGKSVLMVSHQKEYLDEIGCSAYVTSHPDYLSIAV